MFKPSLAFFICLFIVACSGGGGGGGGGGDSDDDSSDPPDTDVEPTLASIQANIFTPICTRCHTGGMPPEGLNLQAGNAYGMLVDVDSTQVPALKRVDPGDPDNSYIVQKIEGTATVGDRMPADGPPYLNSQQIGAIREWIEDGALASFSGESTMMQAAMASPPVQSELTSAPASITLAFSQPVDASRLSAVAVQLIASGGDGRFTDGNERIISGQALRLSSTNSTTAILDLQSVSLAADRYRLVIRGDGDFAVLSLSGIAIDGDNDGISGGDYLAEFSIVAGNK